MSNLRKLRIEDLIDTEPKNEFSTTLCYIPNKQKDFGHKKRIKP